MKKVLMTFLFISSSLHAQNFVRDIEDIQEHIAKTEVDEYLKNGGKGELPGEYLQSLMPKKTLMTDSACLREEEPKKSNYEVVLVVESNSKISKFGDKDGSHAWNDTLDLTHMRDYYPWGKKNSSVEFNKEAIIERAKDLWFSGLNTKWPEGSTWTFDLKNPLARELFMEGLVQAAGNSKLSEAELAKKMAGILTSTFPTEDAKYQALSALSLRLYRNYNNARNPGYNNAKNNPFNEEIPAGDMTLNNLLTAAADFNVFKGGVCNDVVEAVAQIGEHMFPDKDVLTINSGTHFGVLITDGKTHRVIDGGRDMEMQNRVRLDPNISSTNIRINKVVDGRQKEIAVVDTEMGQVMESAFQTGKKLLKTDADVSTMMAHLKKENFGVAVGTARLHDSDVVVIVAKYEYAGDKWKSYIGAGLSAEKFHTDIDTKYQVHFRAGAEREMLKYVNSSTEVKFSSGVRTSAMTTLNQPKNQYGGSSRLDYSLGLDVHNRLDVNYGKHDPKGIQVQSSLEVEHSLGPKNWGNTTGLMSYMSPSDTVPMMKNLKLHLNQVNADVTVEKELSSKVTGIVNTHYQGTNIGQSVSALAGVNIKLPEGAQILVFTGYTKSDIKGFETKHSLLGTPSGAQVGAKYTTKGGIEIGGSVRSISGGKSSVNATIKVPLK